MAYVYLAIAIVAEVVATSYLRASEGMTKPGPSAVVLVGYGVAFYLLTLVVQTLPISLTYAIWSGMGIVLITVAGAVFYKEVPDRPALIGMAFIVVGVVVVNGWSKMAAH